MDFTMVAGAAGAIKAAIDIGKAAVSVHDANRLLATVTAMNEQLLNAQQSLFAHNTSLMELQQKYFEATQELREIKETLTERQRYSLFEIVPGTFTYRMNIAPNGAGTVDPEGAESVHYICQPCFDAPVKRKVVLKFFSAGSYNGANWHCPVCKTAIHDKTRPSNGGGGRVSRMLT